MAGRKLQDRHREGQTRCRRVLTLVMMFSFVFARILPPRVCRAASMTIDNFEEQTQNLAVGHGSALDADCSDEAASILGGERDALLELLSGTSSSYLDINAGESGEISFSAGSGDHLRALVSWDGADHDPLTLDPTGLGGADLVDDTHDGLYVMINHWDGNHLEIRFTVYTNETDYSSAVLELEGGGDIPPARIYALSFEDDFFETGAGADFTNVGAVTMEFQTISTGSDVSIDLLGLDTSRDFGDLPAEYAITAVDHNGARHTNSATYFGYQVDAEADAHFSARARGDNLAGDNDEDGVVRVGKWQDGEDGAAVQFQINSPHANLLSCVDGWLDWNGDADFDDFGEHVLDGVLLYQIGDENNFTRHFDVPAGTFQVSGKVVFFSRWRIVPDRNGNASCLDEVDMTYDGYIRGGEVEDYFWEFDSPSAVVVTGFSAANLQENRIISRNFWMGMTFIFLFLRCFSWFFRQNIYFPRKKSHKKT